MAYVYLLTSARYCAGVVLPVAKPTIVDTNLPNTKFIKGNNVPAAMAATKATILSAQLLPSAYLKTRFTVVRSYYLVSLCLIMLTK
jgi:hypothetical protein